MSNLIPVSAGGFLAKREERALSRHLTSLERSKAIGLAKLEQQAQLEAAKAHAVGYVGQQAMQAVTMVSQMEGQLGQTCPLAVIRLQGLADMTALSTRAGGGRLGPQARELSGGRLPHPGGGGAGSVRHGAGRSGAAAAGCQPGGRAGPDRAGGRRGRLEDPPAG